MAIASSFSLGGIILLMILGVGVVFMIATLFDIDIFAFINTDPHDPHDPHDLLNPYDHLNPHNLHNRLNDSTHTTSDNF